MPDKKILGSYENGNTFVILYEDGSKTRMYPDGVTPAPAFPESIDLKITDRCTGTRCPFCAEGSHSDGAHADLTHPILDTIHPFTELAIGGGNPLEHPDLVPFLQRMRDRKVICNLTVSVYHFIQKENVELLEYLTREKLIYGLGVSVPYLAPPEFFCYIHLFPNLVVHTIAGVTSSDAYIDLAGHDLNLLILGFKNKGRGKWYLDDHWPSLSERIAKLGDSVLSLRPYFKGIAFDNLAVRQLNLRDKLPPEEFNRLYMGDDGEFTMYVNLVDGTYARSSTDEPDFINDTIDQLFQEIRVEEGIG